MLLCFQIGAFLLLILFFHFIQISIFLDGHVQEVYRKQSIFQAEIPHKSLAAVQDLYSETVP